MAAELIWMRNQSFRTECGLQVSTLFCTCPFQHHPFWLLLPNERGSDVRPSQSRAGLGQSEPFDGHFHLSSSTLNCGRVLPAPMLSASLPSPQRTQTPPNKRADAEWRRQSAALIPGSSPSSGAKRDNRKEVRHKNSVTRFSQYSEIC